MASGGLVGDAVIIDLVRARLERPDTSGGFVLDGFPRTVRQAQVLDQILESRGGLLAVVLSVPDEELSRRLAVRRTCGGCGVPDALAAPLGNEEQCVLCGAVLARRNDDNAATVMRRLFTYRVQAGPIVGYYRQRDGCTIVDGSKDADLVFARIAAHVDDQLTGRADAAMMGSGPGA
jgi:adenylate kinase